MSVTSFKFERKVIYLPYFILISFKFSVDTLAKCCTRWSLQYYEALEPPCPSNTAKTADPLID